MTNLHELPKGTKIGKYRVEFLVGAGGFGHVYKVIDINTKQNFALKTESSEISHSFLKNEISCLGHLNDSCFPSVRDSGQYKNLKYFVMNIYAKKIRSVIKDEKD